MSDPVATRRARVSWRVGRSNPYLECPNCAENTLETIGSDVVDSDVGVRRYRCEECRHVYTSVETFIVDDEGNEDCFRQLALNVRLREREKHQKLTGHQPRRQLKATDSLRVERSQGRVTITYVRSPKMKAVFLMCKNGHKLEGDNVGINTTTGNRLCLTCKRNYQRDWSRTRDRLRRETPAA